ncbi:MAG: hypothetical protein K1X92_14350 [Bacteroidia bacterium]|nr:hypothetical protein [Bacteroidia bacterium]
MLRYILLILLFFTGQETVMAGQAFPESDCSVSAVRISPPDDNPKKHDINSIIALIVLFLIPYLGIHRVIMGGSYWLIVGYIVSFGGFFGLLPFMDFVRILIEPEHFRGNNKFLAAFGFM